MKLTYSMLIWISLIVHICSRVTDADNSTRARTSAAAFKDYQALEVVGKDPIQLVKLRGFKAELHYARTRDGYYIQLVRIVNPLARPSVQLKRPVIINHGLLESATIFLEYAENVKPLAYVNRCAPMPDAGNTTYRNAAMMLANHGYDVWLMSVRGTEFSLHHDRLSPLERDFWDFSLDNLALQDIPAVIRYVRGTTDATKVGYIGHSQATFSVFALLAARPAYADIIEPVVAIAPIAYVSNARSITRPIFLASLLTKSNLPFPPLATELRAAIFRVCASALMKGPSPVCQLIEMLVAGKGREWLKGFYSQFPYLTSLKIVRHFGQMIRSNRFSRYDYGKVKNLEIYGQAKAPLYLERNIQSRSLCLISAQTDALSTVKDIEKFRRRLAVPLYKDIMIQGKFDHFDLLLNERAAFLVNLPILEIFESFENKTCEDVTTNRQDDSSQQVDLPVE